MKYAVIMFDENQVHRNYDLRQLAIQTERQAQKDGYTICYNDGDGLFTFVEFETRDEFVLFNIKYMSYKLEIPYWMAEHYAR